MRIITLISLLATSGLVPVATVGAQANAVGRLGESVRVTAITPSADSVLRGRLSWVSADSIAVWGHGASTTLPIGAVRSIEVQRRPQGYAKRTITTAVVLGVAGGVLGARLGQCRRSGAPAGSIDLSCDTPDGRSTAFAVLGSLVGAGTGWLVQSIREPKLWTPAELNRR
jgi:hypothetical protein